MGSIRTMARQLAGCSALALAGVALVAAACGGGTSSSDKTATAQAGRAGTTPAATAASRTAAPSTLASGATGSATVNVSTSGDKRFVDANGMSLYVFKNDTAGSAKSACTAGCATAWPPLTVGAGATPTAGEGVDGLAVITRDDGTMQVTYDGLPLYHFGGDKAPGDENGKSVSPNWALATP